MKSKLFTAMLLFSLVFSLNLTAAEKKMSDNEKKAREILKSLLDRMNGKNGVKNYTFELLYKPKYINGFKFILHTKIFVKFNKDGTFLHAIKNLSDSKFAIDMQAILNNDGRFVYYPDNHIAIKKLFEEPKNLTEVNYADIVDVKMQPSNGEGLKVIFKNKKTKLIYVYTFERVSGDLLLKKMKRLDASGKEIQPGELNITLKFNTNIPKDTFTIPNDTKILVAKDYNELEKYQLDVLKNN